MPGHAGSPRPASRQKLITMVSSIGATAMPWRASTVRSYLMFCPTLSTASLSSSGLSAASAASRGICTGTSANMSGRDGPAECSRPRPRRSPGSRPPDRHASIERGGFGVDRHGRAAKARAIQSCKASIVCTQA
jgi:hypothetical protein